MKTLTRNQRIEKWWLLEVLVTGRRKFAACNGMIQAKNEFTIEALVRKAPHGGKTRFGGSFACSPIFDHLEFFRWPYPPFAAACVVSHVNAGVHNAPKHCSQWAEQHGLLAHVCEDSDLSWYAPGFSLAIAFTLPDTSVVWSDWRSKVSSAPEGLLETFREDRRQFIQAAVV